MDTTTTSTTLLQTLMASGYFYPVVIVLGVIALSVLAIWVSRRFGIKIISTIKSIVEFIENTLTSLDFKDNDKLGLVISLIAQGISYALAISSTDNIDEKVDDAISFIRNISNQLDQNITESEYEVIRSVLRMCFVFISTLGLNTGLKYNKKLNKELIKYAQKLQLNK